MFLAELGKYSTSDDRGNKNHWHKDYLNTVVLFFPSFFLTTHKFVRIVYGQLFHLSAVMAGINRPLNTGSCEFSILWLVASGITVVILIWWNILLQYDVAALFHLAENKEADSCVVRKLTWIIWLVWGGFDGSWWSHICFVMLLNKCTVWIWSHGDIWLPFYAGAFERDGINKNLSNMKSVCRHKHFCFTANCHM